eukprot:6173632-Pleurochrysis_carterae.AAC.9
MHFHACKFVARFQELVVTCVAFQDVHGSKRMHVRFASMHAPAVAVCREDAASVEVQLTPKKTCSRQSRCQSNGYVTHVAMRGRAFGSGLANRGGALPARAILASGVRKGFTLYIGSMPIHVHFFGDTQGMT